MSAISRRRAAPLVGAWAALLPLALVVAMVGLPTIAASMDADDLVLVSPAAWVLDGLTWSETHTRVLLAIFVPVLALLALVVAVAIVRRVRRRSVDVAAPLLAHGRELKRWLPHKVRQRHRQMGLRPDYKYPGVQLGFAVAGGTPLRARYEDSIALIAGPRRQKTRTIVVPNILLAPGACLATSVRPDIIDATIDHRIRLGAVSVFDPQGLAPAHETHRAWWNPLDGVHSLEDANLLAEVLQVATYGAETGGKNAFFTTNGRTVLRDYLFAAALTGRHLPAVVDWLNREDNDEPARLLRAEYPSIAEEIAAMQSLAKDTRSGVFGHARGAVAFLTPAMRAWVTPREDRAAFDPVAFAAAPGDTLYLLSEEDGSAGPLIAALTKAVVTAAETAAKRAGGVREVPMVLVLDEVANICRLPELPAKYSTWGGRRIVPIAVLQSEEQGQEVWGSAGFDALWNAATVQVFAGGHASPRFLQNLCNRIGDYEYDEHSTTYQNGQQSRTSSRHREFIFDVADLDALDEQRMFVFGDGARPVLARMVPVKGDWRLRLRLLRARRAHAKAEREAAAIAQERDRHQREERARVDKRAREEAMADG